MKQQNFLFVDIVSSIFLLVILMGNFMGLFYITDGNLVISILGSVFLVICYFFVVQQLKKNKEVMKKKNYLHGSSLFWFLFIMLGFLSFVLMSHFINIEYNCKEHINDEAKSKIKLVDSLVSVYKKRSKEDVLNFESELKTKLTQYKSTKSKTVQNELMQEPYNMDARVFINPTSINIDMVANAKVTPYQLKIEKNIQNMDTTIRMNSEKYLSVFANWKRLSLVATYASLNQYVEENIVLINSKIAELPLDKTPIEVSFDKNQIPLNSPSKLNKMYPPQIAIPFITILLLHLFILIPFLSHNVRAYRNSAPIETRGTKTI